MKKPGLLRAAIAALLPDMARDPDRLAMWVERGNVRATGNAQRGFSWEYDLIVVAENYTGDPAQLFFVVVDWLRVQQPDLLQANSPGFPFEVDVIDARTVDVRMTLPLREVVTAALVGGEWQLTVVAETVPLLPDDTPLRANEAPLASIWARGDDEPFQVAP
ncbi:phage tail protein [Novosphingobium sp. FGD1]|uniref:Phage tail protein n=1 Tax=Novosphingobium silvae TaxID=2692619 RepID=A0A7X4GDS1_9SPHN|nr:phage tail protein [Novosphingobium silvae]MYL96439.1 phage tail protein [Novosphingobium silvae]